MKGFVNDLLDQSLGLFGAFATARGILLDPGNATLRKSASPQAHRLGATAKLSSDFLVSDPDAAKSAILDRNTNRAGVERPRAQRSSSMRSLSDSLIAGAALITNVLREV